MPRAPHLHQEIDVLLTYPADPVRLFDSLVPLGIASIAAVLEAHDYSVKVLDFNYYRGDFRSDLERWRPKIVGIGGTTATRKGSFLTARLAKEVLPSAPVVFGGPHATFTAADTLSNVPEIDFVVKGEGEFPFLGLCNHFAKGMDIDTSALAGVCSRSTGGITENAPVRIENLDDLPLPARHLFGGKYALTLDFFNLSAEFIMTSRGCPACCTFCSASRMFPGGVRYRSMEHVRRELDGLLKARRIAALKLFDSTFTSNPEHVAAFCDLIRPYGLSWECEVRADTVDLHMLQRMKQAGCVYVNVGLETSNPRLLARTAKNICTEQVEACLAWCRETGIKTKLFMIFGHPGQTFGDCMEDISYIKTHRKMIDFFATTVGMRVYPGTALEASLKKNNLIPGDFSWAQYKAPLKNWLLFEPGDVLILDQPGLNFFHLLGVIVLLAKQMTLTSGAYILKMLGLNTRVYGYRIFLSAVHLRHWVVRMIRYLLKRH
jgi:anaerobic magnesium-protoporphyrin IX monomethyl ester cyclase